MSILSLEDLELTAKMQLYPFICFTITKLKPVLPDVVSIISITWNKIPLSASSIIYNAILSFEVTWIKGFLLWHKNYLLNSSVILLSLISGVFPISSNIIEAFISFS
jgi:hypothetical protein